MSFDLAVYSLETIKKAAYRFIDRFSPDIRIENNQIICVLSFAVPTSHETQRIVDDFRKEVLDQDLRRLIAAETAPMRNTILALAFATSNLQDRE